MEDSRMEILNLKVTALNKKGLTQLMSALLRFQVRFTLYP
jgi:hypothetical protein